MWCSEKIISALTQLAGENRSKEAFLQAMRDATTGMTKLCGPSAPASVYTTLQQVSLAYMPTGPGYLACTCKLGPVPKQECSAPLLHDLASLPIQGLGQCAAVSVRG